MGHRGGAPTRVLRRFAWVAVGAGLIAALGAGCASDDGAVPTVDPSPSTTTEPSMAEDSDLTPDHHTDSDREPGFEFVITDVFTSTDTGRVILVGYQFAGSLARGDVVETFTVGPASQVSILQIDRVTPSPLTRDVDRLLEGEAGNIELSGGLAEDYIQGQTIVPPVSESTGS